MKLLNVSEEINRNKLTYVLVVILLIIAFILRTWRIDTLLGFYFDQGRDALVIERILKGDLVLIGPVTGLEGIFLGPFYYYFLTPGYFIGQGDPVIASYWQTFFIVIGLFATFLIVRFYVSKVSAILILFLLTFSNSEIIDNRWLANPAPTTLFGPLTVLFLGLALKNSTKFLPFAALGLSILLQLEASISFFLIIITIFLIFIYRKRFKLKLIILSFLVFFITLLPQLIFEVKNNFLLTKNLLGFLSSNTYGDKEQVFQLPTLRVLQDRINLYSEIFINKLVPESDKSLVPVFIIFLIFAIYISFKYWSKPLIKVITFWFFGTLILFTFYQGNYGIVYAYYFTPLVPIFFIFLAQIIDYFQKFRIIKLGVFLAAFILVLNQTQKTHGYLQSGIGENTINLFVSKEAVKFVLNDSQGKEVNVDIYVPPGIPYQYTYLFHNLGENLNEPSDDLKDILYTIHEVDLQIPEREQKWLKRQDGIGKVIKTAKFGGISVEKRERLKKE